MQEVLQKLSFTASGELSPMTAMFGGVVGQEVMKAASGKFHPLYQFFYFDSIESLPEEALSPEDVAPLVCCRSAWTVSCHSASKKKNPPFFFVFFFFPELCCLPRQVQL